MPIIFFAIYHHRALLTFVDCGSQKQAQSITCMGACRRVGQHLALRNGCTPQFTFVCWYYTKKREVYTRLNEGFAIAAILRECCVKCQERNSDDKQPVRKQTNTGAMLANGTLRPTLFFGQKLLKCQPIGELDRPNIFSNKGRGGARAVHRGVHGPEANHTAWATLRRLQTKLEALHPPP